MMDVILLMININYYMVILMMAMNLYDLYYVIFMYFGLVVIVIMMACFSYIYLYCWMFLNIMYCIYYKIYIIRLYYREYDR